MTKLKRARKRKPETSQGGSEATNLGFSGGQGVHREVESEGHEKKYRAVIDGGHPEDELVGHRWDRSSLHYGGEGALIHPPHQGVCGRHGTEEQGVTSGGLAGFSGGTEISGPISKSEMASDAPTVDGRLCSTTRRRKPRDRATGGGCGPGKAAGEDGRGGKETGGVRSREVEQFHE